jgi:hypothetical protein
VYTGDEPSRYPVCVYANDGIADAARFCGLNDKADEAGFIAVYPKGINGRVDFREKGQAKAQY